MIVGMVGFKGSGKDTVGNILVNSHKFVKDSFATTLKDVCSVIFNWSREMLEGDTDKSRYWREQTDIWWESKLGIENFSPRLALQLVGTDALREHFNPDIWLLTVENRLRSINHKNVVICDCRFANEISMIKKIGGQIWHVDRDLGNTWYDVALNANKGDEVSKELMKHYYGVHQSEWAWINDKYDKVIDNNKSLLDLSCQINKILYNI